MLSEKVRKAFQEQNGVSLDEIARHQYDLYLVGNICLDSPSKTPEEAHLENQEILRSW